MLDKAKTWSKVCAPISADFALGFGEFHDDGDVVGGLFLPTFPAVWSGAEQTFGHFG